MKTINSTDIVTFHYNGVASGRGAHFSVDVDVYDLQYVINHIESNNVFLIERDPLTGRFCKHYLVDGSGNEVCDTPYDKVGVLDFDGKYDMYVAKYVSECDEDQLYILEKNGFEIAD